MKKVLISSALVVGLLASQASASSYTVKKGDTLYGIAKKAGTTVANIKEWNNLKSDQITIGKVLQTSKPVVNNTGTHTVKKGDTLYSVSKKYGVSIANLKKWNALTDTLPLGRVIIVKQPTGEVKYAVQKGDTLYAISKRTGVSLTDLQKWNPGVSTLKIGQVIVIGNGSVVTAQTPAEKQAIMNTVAYETVTTGATWESIAAKNNISPTRLKEMNPKLTKLTVGDVLAVSKSKLINPVFGINNTSPGEKEQKLLYVEVSDEGTNIKSAGNGVIVAAGQIEYEDAEIEEYYVVVRYILPTGTFDVEYYVIDEVMETTVVGKTLTTGEVFAATSEYMAIRVSLGGENTLVDPLTFFNY